MAVEECDVSDADSVRNAFARATANLGPAWILVNNAGIAHVGNVLNTTEAGLLFKDIAIAVFGVYDKLALFVAMVVAAAALAAGAGKLARRRWVLAAGLVLGLATVIGACVLTRTAAAPARREWAGWS